jgi:CelD/BcsL family acetyltransferase involved in cellulose biosynthesis
VHGTIEPALRVEWRPLAELAPVAGDWRALAARALDPNVFYEPAFALAAQAVFGRDAGACLVWSRGVTSRLVGFFPARIERRRYGIPFPVLCGWTHPYAPLGTPLVDRDASDAAIGAWLDHLARDKALPKIVLLPYLPRDHNVSRALDAALNKRGGKAVSFARHERALLSPGSDRESYLDHALGHKKRKELRRQRRRLGENGVLDASDVTDADEVAKALNDFLVLEASGWKGRAGTAAADHADIRTFMERAVKDLAAEGKVSAHRLTLDAHPIAAIVTLYSGATAWTWKTAYNEAFAASSPGVQLMLDVTEALLARSDIAQTDSCATAHHPMINHLWRERLPLADRFIRVGPEHKGAFALACTLEASRRAAITTAKSLRDLMRRR